MSDAALPIGAIVIVEGRRMRHAGGGRFEPYDGDETFEKRFAPWDCEPIGGRSS